MFNKTIRITRAIIHFIIILTIFFLTYKLRLTTDLIPGIQLRIPPIIGSELFIFATISAILFSLIGIIKNLYDLNKPVQKYFQTFSKVWIYRFISITFIAYFGGGFLFEGWISRFIIVLTSFLTFFGLFFFDQIRNYIEAKRNRNSDHKILIITNNITHSYEAIQKIKKWFSFKSELIEISDIKNTKFEDYIIVIAVGNFDKKILQDLFEKIRLSDTRFFHISEWYFLEDVVYTPEKIDNIIALEYKHSQLDWWSIIFKRVFDIIASIVLIIISTPIMVIIAIITKITSSWPIFFIQKRVGKNNKLFTFIKFRSMIQNAEKMKTKLLKKNERKGPLFKIKNDPRITPFGKFLRKTSLDELPNLFLVFTGKMSLVGPRPHLPAEVKNYESRQKRLLSIKPWITWYAQIYGRDDLNFNDEARLDLYYIQRRSIMLDLYILFATFGVVFKGK